MNRVILILFMLYSLIIIFIENIYIILSLLAMEVILLFLLKVKIKLKNIAYFLVFIFLMNTFLINFWASLLITLRLLTMYLIVLIVIKKIGINNIAYTFFSLFHSRDLYLIISIALTFIPIMKDEIVNIKKSLLVKNYECNLANIVKNPKVLVVTFFHNLFSRVLELEKVVIISGFYD